jgi:mono/diheme cytochrome c family protein
LAGSVPALIGTDYGHLLLVKIALFAAMVSIAAINRFRLTPLLSNQSGRLRGDALRRLTRNAMAEFVLGLAIFVVVGALGTMPPGLHTQPEWPLPFRLSTDILADRELGPRAFLALFAALAGVILILAGVFLTARRRFLIIGGTFVALSLAGQSAGFFERAYPTTFYASPTGYSADSIAQGHRIFVENCAVCHGTTGGGDGPAAAQAQRKPADLTAEHIYAHRDGDLFWWITNGIDTAMPAFREVLDETARWNLIDFVHANADGARLRASAAEAGPTGYPTPNFSAACRGEATVSTEEVRGSVVHVVLAPGESIVSIKGILDRDRVLEVTTIFAVSDPIEGIETIACVSDDPSLLDVMAIYGGIDAGRAGRIEWLIDASGLLRSMRSSFGTIRGDWADDEVFREALRALRQQPESPQHTPGHLHH